MNLREYLGRQQQLVEAELDRLVPPQNTVPETIHRAMRYSLFAGGKRIRPILCMEAAYAAGGDIDGVTIPVREPTAQEAKTLEQLLQEEEQQPPIAPQ